MNELTWQTTRLGWTMEDIEGLRGLGDDTWLISANVWLRINCQGGAAEARTDASNTDRFS